MSPGHQQSSTPSLELGTKAKPTLLYGRSRKANKMRAEGLAMMGHGMEEE